MHYIDSQMDIYRYMDAGGFMASRCISICIHNSAADVEIRQKSFVHLYGDVEKLFRP